MPRPVRMLASFHTHLPVRGGQTIKILQLKVCWHRPREAHFCASFMAPDVLLWTLWHQTDHPNCRGKDKSRQQSKITVFFRAFSNILYFVEFHVLTLPQLLSSPYIWTFNPHYFQMMPLLEMTEKNASNSQWQVFYGPNFSGHVLLWKPFVWKEKSSQAWPVFSTHTEHTDMTAREELVQVCGMWHPSEEAPEGHQKITDTFNDCACVCACMESSVWFCLWTQPSQCSKRNSRSIPNGAVVFCQYMVP